MLTANNFKRKRPRLSSSAQVASSPTNTSSGSGTGTATASASGTGLFRKKKQQQFATSSDNSCGMSSSYGTSEVINLDSDADDYVFKDDNMLVTSDEYFAYEDIDGNYLSAKHESVPETGEVSDDFIVDNGVRLRSSFSSYYNTNSLNMASLRLTSSNNSVGTGATSHTLVNRFNKKRTKSLPQLSYSKVTYRPNFDKESVLEKIGDVKTTLIQHQFANYTYGSSPKSLNRKFSFNSDLPPSYGNSSYINSSNSSRDSYESANTSVTLTEETPCDDKDGHYIIEPGASFANDRFQIQCLLGQGTFGKVIKAYDRHNNCAVAIKIIRSIPKYREASKIELRVLTMLKKHDPENVNQCIHLRECFDYRGHICIVTDILKISLYDFLDKNHFQPFPGSHVQAIAKQLLRSVAFLHDLNLIHTDLKPENILLKDDSFKRRPHHKAGTGGVTKMTRNVLNDPKIYTIDFGSAIFDDEYHSSVVYTRHYRAPEIILGVGWSFPCDMWSVGCILVELVTGDALFKTHENAQHLAMMEQVLCEPIDLKLVRKCFNQFYHSSSSRRRSSGSSSSQGSECIANSFSKTTGKLLFPTPKTPIKLIDEVERLPSLANLIGGKLGFQFDSKLSLKESIAKFKIPKREQDDYEFWYWFIDLVKKLFVFDPEHRLTAVEALEHKWFDRGIFDDGTSL